MSSYIRLGQDGRGYKMFGQVKPGKVRLNHVRLGLGSLVHIRSS
jgi:hypothetical protein